MRLDLWESLSSCRPVCFILRRLGVNQGEEEEKETVAVFRGASASREVERVELSMVA